MTDHSEELDDDVPPLEDMSEELERVKARIQATSSQEKTPVAKSAAPQTRLMAHKTVVTDSTVAKAPKQTTTNSSSSFGGFKKGFLFSQPSKKDNSHKTKTKLGTTKPISSNSNIIPSGEESRVPGTSNNSKKDDDSIPFVKPKSGEAGRGSGLEFPEVQSAMKESYPLLNTQDWVTDDLLSKIEKHPVLSKVFQDPQLSQVVTQFQKNPQAALEATKGNSEMQTFLQEFSALMGDHFTQLADKEDASKPASSNVPLISEVSSSTPPPTSKDDEQMREKLAKPEVRHVLEDPEIQRLIVALKTKPEDAQRMLRSGSDDFRLKIKILIDNGLLAMQQF